MMQKHNLWIISIHSSELTITQWKMLKEFLYKKKVRHYAQKLPFKGEMKE